MKLTIEDLRLLLRYRSMQDTNVKGTMCSDSPIYGKRLKVSSSDIVEHFFGYHEKILGHGSYGAVGKTTANYAVKYSKKGFNTLKEIAILNSLNHPNLLCIDAYFGVQEYAYYLPLASGTLYTVMGTLKADPVLRRDAYYQIFCGLAYLHSVYIIHADLKPANILMFKDGEKYTYKIADFGLSIPCSYADVEHYSTKMTLQWRPPELLAQNIKNKHTNIEISEKIDIWAMGIIMFDMIYQFNDKYHLFAHIKNPNEKHILQNIHSQMLTQTDKNTLFAPNEKYLAEQCLQINVSERPSAIECLKDDFFKSIRKQADLDLILKNTKSTPNDYIVETYNERELLCDIVMAYTHEMNEFDAPDETIYMIFFYAMFLLDEYFSDVASPLPTFEDFKLKSEIYEKESRILSSFEESFGIPNDEKYMQLRLKTNRTEAEQKEFMDIEQLLKGNMEDLFFVETFNRLNNYKNIFLTSQKYKALDELYDGIDKITDVDTYKVKFYDIINTLKAYSTIYKLISGAINLAILFISEETLDRNFTYFDEDGIEDLLKIINYNMYIPTAIQYFVKKNGQLPTNAQFKKLYEKLRKSPFQKKIVDDFEI